MIRITSVAAPIITNELHAGDWVEIYCPSKPWFHGQIAEVVRSAWDADNSYYFARDDFWNMSRAWVELVISKTPGHFITRWNAAELRLVPHSRALDLLGEDYFD